MCCLHVYEYSFSHVKHCHVCLICTQTAAFRSSCIRKPRRLRCSSGSTSAIKHLWSTATAGELWSGTVTALLWTAAGRIKIESSMKLPLQAAPPPAMNYGAPQAAPAPPQLTGYAQAVPPPASNYGAPQVASAPVPQSSYGQAATPAAPTGECPGKYVRNVTVYY